MGIIHQGQSRYIGAPWIQTSGKRRFGGVSWFLSGGISAANCIAAYQPKGAASLAASYTNLATPGTYNAAPGVAPTWDVTSGWIFNGSSQYLISVTITASNNWSMIIRFSNSVSSAQDYIMAGLYSGASNRFFLRNTHPTNKRAYGNGNILITATPVASGTMALSGLNAYFNSTSDGAITAGVLPAALPIFIGCGNSSGIPSLFWPGAIQSMAIYDTAITSDQVTALTTAMAAL